MDVMQENKVIGWAQSKQFSEKEIVEFYNNVAEKGGSRKALDAIKIRMRSDYPRVAKRRFGAKEEEVVERLNRIADAAQRGFPLQDSRVGSHVKTGGNEISGEKFLWRYISYKNPANQGADLSLVQDKADTEVLVFVSRYRTNAKEANFNEVQQFAFGELDQAEALYRRYLGELTGN
ncbi:MAG TPA: hypothetical protein VFF81_12115 [Noviherbaspirillum sp.]|nr:hypothetical protein [Noviherbaspirillum sp.]